MRIYFNAWGPAAKRLKLPKYAVKTADQWMEKQSVVAHAIARKNGLQVISIRDEGLSLIKGKPDSMHYLVQLGRFCRGGGWTPEAEIWISLRMSAPLIYAVKHVKKFYDYAPNKTSVLRDPETDEVALFMNRKEAKEWAAGTFDQMYCLDHNQYGYEFQVIDITKPRNAAWLEMELGGY